MRGEKTIKFDFPIQYSENGVWAETDNITVRAPGLGKYDVYATMQAYVSKAVLNFARSQDGMRKGDAIEDDDDASAGTSEDDGDERDVMMIMAMGLDLDTYPKFGVYVKKVLTNAPKLASIGDDKKPLTDEAWLSIESGGGMEAVNRILSEFTGFFFDALGSAKKSGASKSASSASPSKAVSVSNTAKVSRSKNSIA